MTKRDKEMFEAVLEAENDEESDSEYVRPQRPKAPAQVFSVRIPVDRLAELKRVADQLDVGPSTLMRTWVMERLDRETHPSRVAEPSFRADEQAEAHRQTLRRYRTIQGTAA